ncbi:MAG: DUF3667 domain-containing protein [Gilvibacter sp.]
MSDKNNICNNCQTAVAGNFCHHCGQRSHIDRVTFKETFGDLADGLFSLQAPIWKTVKHLIIKPGVLLREFLSGKRKHYYKPVSFFIVVSALYLLVRWAIDFDILSDNTINVGGAGDSEILNKARAFMLIHIDKLLFFFVLSMAVLLKLFFYKRHSLAEYFAVAFFMVGFYMILQTINIVFTTYVDATHHWYGLAAMFLYFLIAMVSFFKRPKFWIVVKSVFVYVIGFGMYMSMAFGLSVLIAAFNRS